MKYYSAINNAFYPSEFEDDYINAGTWPTDPVEVGDSVFDEFSGLPPAGKTRAAGSDGQPVWIDVPAPSKAQLVAMADIQKSILVSVGMGTISVWQSELLLGEISDADEASLKLWIAYIKSVEAVDTSTAPDVTWPKTPA